MSGNGQGSGAIGTPTPYLDGVEKVTGKAKFTADFLEAGALVGRILRSPLSHAEVVALDVSEALALPGVAAVLTGADCKVPFGILPIAMNEFPLARERVRYRGEPLAAVAAIDEATAEAALALIKVELKELPAYYTAEEARAADAVQLHDERPGNIEREVTFELGDTAAADCEVRLRVDR